MVIHIEKITLEEIHIFQYMYNRQQTDGQIKE